METILEIVRIEQIICETEEGVNYMKKVLKMEQKLLLDLLDVMTVKYSLLCV